MKLFKTDADVDKAIVRVRSNGKALQSLVQKTGVSVLNRWNVNGDAATACHKANMLIEALPSMARKNALRGWFENFAKFSWDNEVKAFEYTDTKINAAQVKLAHDTMFTDYAPEPEFVPMNLTEEFGKFVGRMIGRAKKNNEGDDFPKDVLDALATLKKSMGSEGGMTIH